MNITKIKYSSKTLRIKIEWQDAADEDANKFSFDNKREIPASFKNAFLDLRKHVNKLCELGMKEDEMYLLEVVGVSLSWSHGVMGATITALKTLKDSNQPLVLNTPHKIEDFYSENGGDEKQLMPSDAVNDIIKLMAEAKAFIKSKEVQMDLFGETQEAA